MRSSIFISIVLFVVLSVVSVQISGAPLKVHLVDIGSFFVAFVLSRFASEYNWLKINEIKTWLIFATIGLVAFDVFSAIVIAKRELFMAWYVIYPVGILGFFLLQLLTSFISEKVPYNK